MTNAEKLTLKKHACHIRMGVIEGTHSAGCGHPGGSLSIADVLSYLYFKELNIDPAQPKMASRDRLVLSKGHAAPALYAALAERGFFPVEELKTLRRQSGSGHLCRLRHGAGRKARRLCRERLRHSGRRRGGRGRMLGGLYVCRPLRPF